MTLLGSSAVFYVYIMFLKVEINEMHHSSAFLKIERALNQLTWCFVVL